MLKLIKTTTLADAERVADTAPPVRYRETSESAIAAAQRMQRSYSAKQADKILGTGPHCTGLCHQGRRPCVHPVECGVTPAPAEASTELGAEPVAFERKPAPQDIGEAIGTVLGWVLLCAVAVALVLTLVNHAPKP